MAVRRARMASMARRFQVATEYEAHFARRPRTGSFVSCPTVVLKMCRRPSQIDAALWTADQATTSVPASHGPRADAPEHPSLTTSFSRCCDDRLNPPSTSASVCGFGSTRSITGVLRTDARLAATDETPRTWSTITDGTPSVGCAHSLFAISGSRRLSWPFSERQEPEQRAHDGRHT